MCKRYRNYPVPSGPLEVSSHVTRHKGLYFTFFKTDNATEAEVLAYHCVFFLKGLHLTVSGRIRLTCKQVRSF